MKIKALVYVPHDAAMKEYYNLFLNCGNVNPTFIVDAESSYEQKIVNENWGLLRLYNKAEPSRISIFKKGIVEYVKKRFIDDSLLGVWLQKRFTPVLSRRLESSLFKLKNEVKKLIIDKSINSIFITNDRSCGYEAAVLLAAAESKIPSFIVPYAFSASYESCLTLRARKVYNYSTNSNCKSNFFIDGKHYNFYRPWERLALKKMLVMPENPWVLGGSGFVKVLVDSERELSRLKANGGEASNYIITGSVAHDRLFKSIENSIKNSVDSSQDYVLLALPQYFEHKICSWSEHFNLVNELVTGLSQLTRKLIVSLHPKMDPNRYEFLTKYTNVEVATNDIIELIPSCSLFVSNYSSTVALALICEKPAVIVDHLGVKYSDFFHEFEIKIFYSNKALFDGLRGCELFDGYRSRYSTTGLSPFDGKCTMRVESEILNILEIT